MAVEAETIVVTTTATALTHAGDTGAQTLVIGVPGLNGTVWVGGPDVTVATGYPVTSGKPLTLQDLDPGDAVYGIAAYAQTVHVLRTGV